MNQDYILHVLTKVEVWIILLPLLIGIIRWKRNGTDEKILLLLLFFGSCADFISLYLASHHRNNLVPLHFYTVAEFTLISFYFFRMIRVKYLKWSVIALLLPFYVIAALDIPSVKLNTSDSLTSAYEGIAIICYSVTYFYLLLRVPIYDNLFNAPPFWFISAFLIYFSGTLFVFVFSSYITENSLETGSLLWGINSVNSILFYLIFTVGLLKLKRK